jgi:hypothetical protein
MGQRDSVTFLTCHNEILALLGFLVFFDVTVQCYSVTFATCHMQFLGFLV